MSATEYNNFLLAISRKFDELIALDDLLFMCRGKLAPGSEGNIHDTLSLCKELEENNNLGIDYLQLMKRLLRGVEDWALLEKVEKFERKRKEYKALLEKVISSLDALNDLERLIAICRGSVREGSEGNIQDVRSLSRELENQDNLEIDYLDVVKNILAETESNELLKELEEFEERRNLEDKSEARKAQRAALMSSVRSTLVGVVNIKTVFKVVAGGLAAVSAMEVLSRWSSFDQLVAAVQTCVLPAGTRLVQITDGCVCLTVQAESLSALKLLWNLYQDGTLQKNLHDFFVTDELRKLADGEDMEVNVTIDEDEYQEACIELIQGTQDNKPCDPKKMEKDTLKMEGSERRESEQLMKLMGAKKMEFVQRYLENVQETCSMTTEASDSGLGTLTVISEEGIEVVRDSKTLCVKDLREESINELDKILSSDKVGLERVFRFFGVKVDTRVITQKHVFAMKLIAKRYPNTPVDLIRQCFEALQMYDLVDFLETAVKPISLRPVLSPEEVETLRTGDLPTKSHNNVAVLVVNFSADKDVNQKIERFFKDLNSQNNVTITGSSFSEENRKKVNDLKIKQMDKQKLSKQLEELQSATSKCATSNIASDSSYLREIEIKVAQLEKEIEMNKPLVEELLKENEETKTIITSTMDNWIQNQEKFTAIVLAFIVDKRESIEDFDVSSECVKSKLTSLPDHTKILVGGPWRKVIIDIPEFLSVGTPIRLMNSSIVNSMIEIFAKRYREMDLASMLRELVRKQVIVSGEIRSHLSAHARFEKRKEQKLERS